MAGGWTRDGAVLDQIEDTVTDGVLTARARMAAYGADRIDGSEEREITLVRRGQSTVVKGQPYLLEQAMPNFYFHLTTAYAILRHNGVEVGKKDYLGTS